MLPLDASPSSPPIVQVDLTAHPGRVLVVGDLHGMAHALAQLLTLAGFDPERDLLWSLGDLVDRGPFSPLCLELLEKPWFRAIRGNHEQLLLDAVDNRPGWLNWMLNGGDWALGHPWKEDALLRRLAALPWAADLRTRVGRIGLVHADVDRRYDWPQFLDALSADREMARQIALWSRSSANQAVRGLPGRRIAGADLVLVGHSIVESAFQRGNIWFLDSGAVASDDPTAALSMLEIHPQLRLWTLPTAQDPIASLWWSGLSERVSTAICRDC